MLSDEQRKQSLFKKLREDNISISEWHLKHEEHWNYSHGFTLENYRGRKLYRVLTLAEAEQAAKEHILDNLIDTPTETLLNHRIHHVDKQTFHNAIDMAKDLYRHSGFRTSDGLREMSNIFIENMVYVENMANELIRTEPLEKYISYHNYPPVHVKYRDDKIEVPLIIFEI